jgi:hypothetical protein
MWDDKIKILTKVREIKVLECEVVESHLQTNDTGTELGTLSCRAKRQLTRSKVNDRQKVIRER